VLGIASLLVPISHTEKHGIKAGDVNIGLETTQSERVSPIIGVVLIAGGFALTVGGARMRSSTKRGADRNLKGLLESDTDGCAIWQHFFALP
jgi:hypothetical protein